jgi:hypothetical protein
VDAHKAKVIELRVSGWLSVEEIGEALHISTDMITRDWRTPSVWSLHEPEGGAR